VEMSEWIKMHTTLIGHRKVARLMSTLCVGEVHALGMLAKFWMNILRHKSDGNVTGWDAADMAFYAGWDGDEKAFYAALQHIGWIVRDDDGELWVNDWNEHSQVPHRADQTTKWRLQKRNQRAKKRAEKEALSAPVRGPSADASVCPLREERRGEKKEGAATPAPPTKSKQPERQLTTTTKTTTTTKSTQLDCKTPETPATLSPPSSSSGGVLADGFKSFAEKHGLVPLKSMDAHNRVAQASPFDPAELDAALALVRNVGGVSSAGLLLTKILQLRQPAKARRVTNNGGGVGGMHGGELSPQARTLQRGMALLVAQEAKR
jgi:hypothetical protein